jgi:hypothetical protein
MMEAESHPRHLAPMEQNVNISIELGKLLELLREKRVCLNVSTCSSRPEKGVPYNTDAPFTWPAGNVSITRNDAPTRPAGSCRS